MARTQISKPERLALTLTVAQKQAGRGQTPSARQLRRAHADATAAMSRRGVTVRGDARKVDKFVDSCCARLSGITGMGGDECGSFWSRVKDIANKAEPLLPFLGPTATLAAPVAKAAFKGRGGAPVADNAQTDDNTQEVVGYGPERTKVEDATFIFGERTKVEDATFIFGDLMSDEVMVYSEGGGESELGADSRRMGMGMGRMRRGGMMGGGEIPHEVYRAAIFQRAGQMAGGRPQARHIAAAQSSVNRDLARGGVVVGIPGARPGRVTR